MGGEEGVEIRFRAPDIEGEVGAVLGSEQFGALKPLAAGEELPLRQNEILTGGHSIEVRLCAENPENQFLPADLRRGTGPNDFGDAFAEYALYYGLGVDAGVTDFPDLAVMARRG